jgi:hypothetical protein
MEQNLYISIAGQKIVKALKLTVHYQIVNASMFLHKQSVNSTLTLMIKDKHSPKIRCPLNVDVLLH